LKLRNLVLNLEQCGHVKVLKDEITLNVTSTVFLSG
jgi:hypothetical protein